MRTSRPVAEKLGAIRQDPDLDGLLFGLISRATGGCHEHAARLDHPQVVGAGRGLSRAMQQRLAYGARLSRHSDLASITERSPNISGGKKDGGRMISQGASVISQALVMHFLAAERLSLAGVGW